MRDNRGLRDRSDFGVLSGPLVKFRCSSCGGQEYILSAGVCPACAKHGPPWIRWVLLVILGVAFCYALAVR